MIASLHKRPTFNIQLSTSNSESEFDVGCWMLSVGRFSIPQTLPKPVHDRRVLFLSAHRDRFLPQCIFSPGLRSPESCRYAGRDFSETKASDNPTREKGR